MKKVIVMVLVLASLAITACSLSDSPSAVVEDFYTYAEAGEVNDAYDLVSKGGKEMLQKIGGASIISELTNKIKNKDGINNIDILNEEITGDTATVKIEITYGNDVVDKKTEKLIREEDGWRMIISK